MPMSRTIVAVFVFVIPAIVQAEAQVAESPDEAAVRNVVREYFDRYARKDLAGLIALYSPSAPELVEFEHRLHRMFGETRVIELKELKFESIEISPDANAALVRVSRNLTARHAKKREIHESFPDETQPRVLSLRKHGDAWKVRFYGLEAELGPLEARASAPVVADRPDAAEIKQLIAEFLDAYCAEDLDAAAASWAPDSPRLAEWRHDHQRSFGRTDDVRVGGLQ